MGKVSKLVGVVAASVLLSSCSASLSDYEVKDTNFDLKTYFNGDVIAWGTIQNRSDKVTRRFCVELQGTWQGDQGLLAEKFFFDDGEISYRNWNLTKNEDGSYKGLAEDVIGHAVGKHQGFAFQLQYTLALKVDDSVYEVSMDDWMYQLDEYRVMNKTSISKFGLNVANVTLFFDKQLPVKTCEAVN
jgi:hypothetical protein